MPRGRRKAGPLQLSDGQRFWIAVTDASGHHVIGADAVSRAKSSSIESRRDPS